MLRNPVGYLSLSLVLAGAAGVSLADTVSLGNIGAPLQVDAPYAAATLTLVGPGVEHRATLTAAAALQFELPKSGLADGSYRYRIEFAPRLSAAQQQLLIDARGGGQESTLFQHWKKDPAYLPAPAALSGSFRIIDGAIYAPDSANGSRRDQPNLKDQVIADDLIVQSSICAGFDCVDGENFGFDTLRLKENNTRIAFSDTSVGAFPAVDWQLTANESASGGLDKFSIEDITNARVPFTVEGGTPNNTLYADSTGNVGIGTNVPVLDLQVTTGDTPAHRFEQTNGSGFTAQTWDIGANEANFFVRDVTGGSLLSFRIRPGAPTSSIDIAANGNVGIGTASPDFALEVNRQSATATILFQVTNDILGARGSDKFTVDSNGNVVARGTIAQLSSRTAKENFVAVDGPTILAKLAALPIVNWNYKTQADDDRHLGPVAEDFHAAFGYGNNRQVIATSDLAAVALAAAQALHSEIQHRDRRIATLEARLAALESLLSAPAAAER